ncbi:hypothetical protein MalM25_17450 [Planctomycetes bacterium MalM25]|nr:hypothetical protein MalM25_17450 [Planctomycetes bacterium MalM25]
MERQPPQNANVHPTLQDLVRMRHQTRGFSLLPKQPVGSLLSGQHASRLRGRGLVFEELREYHPGDDIRTMDWRATARLRKAHVRTYSEERERPVLLVVDQRQSMFFGSARTTKAGAAAELAALTAWRAIDGGDRVGALLFGDERINEVRPRRSRANVHRICHELALANAALSADGPRANPGMLNEALRRACRAAAHDHLVVLVTDYEGDDETTNRWASRLSAHNDVLAALVYDPLGVAFPVGAEGDLTDGNDSLRVCVDPAFARRSTAEFHSRVEQIHQRLSSVKIPILPICTHDSVVEQVHAALGGR